MDVRYRRGRRTRRLVHVHSHARIASLARVQGVVFRGRVLMSFSGPAGSAIGMLACDHIGRKGDIIVFSALAFMPGAIYPTVHSAAGISIGGFGVVTTIYPSRSAGPCVPELFPTDLRMHGLRLCNTRGRLMPVITPYMVSWVILFVRRRPPSRRGVRRTCSVTGLRHTLHGVSVVSERSDAHQ